jgi:hypothetical protein
MSSSFGDHFGSRPPNRTADACSSGIMGDGSETGANSIITDPADRANHVETLDMFTGKMEQVARADYGNGADVRALIVHF